MDYSDWNSGEPSQLPNRRDWIMLKGIKNYSINNDRRWFLASVNKNKSELPLT
jgi:hypothetical protein